MEYRRPAEIERRSMELIDEELARRGLVLDQTLAPVIRRVIHASADFDFAEQMTFTEGAVEHGVRSLLRGTTIVTDTNMALAGISKPGLKKLGGKALCFMADADVAEQAEKQETTRAVISVRKASEIAPGCIYAVGNAPTALFELIRQMEQGFRPALLIGVPVGFVNVVEAKKALLAYCEDRRIPAILAMGRKGGSTIAAAICNALIYQALSIS